MYKEDVKIITHITIILAKEKSQYNAIGKILTYNIRSLNKTDNFFQWFAGFLPHRLICRVSGCN